MTVIDVGLFRSECLDKTNADYHPHSLFMSSGPD